MLHRPDLGFRDEGQDLSSAAFYGEAVGRTGDARVLPPLVYRSLRFSLLEDETIWTRDWVCIGGISEIPEDGDLLPFTVGTHGIHVQRVGEELKARFNKAQHGGCRAIPLQCQTGKKTKCSFTSCGYSRDREAIPARDLGNDTPEMQQYLGLRPERLLTAHVARRGPMVFVNLDVTPEANDKAFFEVDRIGRFFTQNDVLLAKGRTEYKANWKLVGQHFADGTPIAESEDDGWIVSQTEVAGEPAYVAWLFPNLVLFRARGETCAVVLQQTSLGQTLCRYFIYGATDANSEPFWMAELERRASNASAEHLDAVRWGTNFRPETIGVALPLQSNPQGLWMQRVLARRAVTAPSQPFPQPLFQHARG